MPNPQPIELLAPARNAVCAREAILHGADAVYIGGPSFGARQAAGNSVEDIADLCRFAHPFGVRIYVTLNTILYDDELEAAQALVWQLWDAGVDALIVQDLALLSLPLPPIPLHASTQLDNRTPEKAQWLEAAGFKQIVVARELSLQQIREISQTVSVPIEAFVHGALCVSYSGRCYASQYCFQRSANRGCCAQFCRLAFDLIDDRGHLLAARQHLLSLKDMNRAFSVEEMLDAGVRSFKVEGRLKDVDYVKNVTAYYRCVIDEVLARRSDEYCRSSYGMSSVDFEPDAARSFNRGFTDYFLYGEAHEPLATPYSPKATGQFVGCVKQVGKRCFSIEALPQGVSPIVAGDGLCFVSKGGKLQGFRVNKVEKGWAFPASAVRLTAGTQLFRNQDFAFEKVLSHPTAKRWLAAEMRLAKTQGGFSLTMADETGCSATLTFPCPHEQARTPQHAAITQTLRKTGETIFRVERVEVDFTDALFIPASLLSDWRRRVCDALLTAHAASYQRDTPGKTDYKRLKTLSPKRLDYSANVANRVAREFLAACGVEEVSLAFELAPPAGKTVLMTCRHCIRRDLGICLKQKTSPRSQLFLRLPDRRTFPLVFDCRNCEMQVLCP